MSLPVSITSLHERLLAAWRERAVALKAVSFALVGLINTAVDAALFFLLLGFATSSLVIANVTAWFVAREHIIDVRDRNAVGALLAQEARKRMHVRGWAMQRDHAR